jgi:uncharacterized damage-inducible protein DinB
MPVATSPCAPFLAEMEQEAVATRRLLERLPADRLAWRPHPKSQTLGQLAYHVASTPGIVPGLLAADVVDGDRVGFGPAQPGSVQEVLAKFDASLAGAKATFGRWGDGELEATWRLRMGGREVMAQPRRSLVRSLVLNHHVHHRGQLTVYLRMLGVPLPSVYGPTADENPMRPPAA